MSHSVIERCRQICGGVNEKCIIDNEKQLQCIADMVVNKSFAISLLLDEFQKIHSPDKRYREIDEAIIISNELSNWVKYLQMTSDLKAMQKLIPSEDLEEKRKEVRFPMPSMYQRYLSLEIGISGTLQPITVLNFSQRGLQFQSMETLENGSLNMYVLKTLHAVKKEVRFKARIKYREKINGAYIVGAEIEEVFDSQSFNFFNNIYDFILELQTTILNHSNSKKNKEKSIA